MMLILAITYAQFRAAVDYLLNRTQLTFEYAIRLAKSLGMDAFEHWADRAEAAAGDFGGFQPGERAGPDEVAGSALQAGLGAATAQPGMLGAGIAGLVGGLFSAPERKTGEVPTYPKIETDPKNVRDSLGNPAPPWTIDQTVEGIYGGEYQRSLRCSRPVVEIARNVGQFADRDETPDSVLRFVRLSSSYRPIWAHFWAHMIPAIIKARTKSDRLAGELEGSILKGITQADYGPGKGPMKTAFSDMRSWLNRKTNRIPYLKPWVREINCRLYWHEAAEFSPTQRWVGFNRSQKWGTWGQAELTTQPCSPLVIPEQDQTDYAIRSLQFIRSLKR